MIQMHLFNHTCNKREHNLETHLEEALNSLGGNRCPPVLNVNQMLFWGLVHTCQDRLDYIKLRWSYSASALYLNRCERCHLIPAVGQNPPQTPEGADSPLPLSSVQNLYFIKTYL